MGKLQHWSAFTSTSVNPEADPGIQGGGVHYRSTSKNKRGSRKGFNFRPNVIKPTTWAKKGAGPRRRGSRIQKGGFVQEFRLENRSYPDVHDFSLRMQVFIANDYVAFDLCKVTIDLKILEFIVLLLMEVGYV